MSSQCGEGSSVGAEASKQSWWGGCARALLANRRNYPPIERRNDGEFVEHEFGPKLGLSGKDNFE